VSARTKKIPERNGSVATHDMWFTAQLPPLGFSTYFVSAASQSFLTNKLVKVKPASDVVISNDVSCVLSLLAKIKAVDFLYYSLLLKCP